MVKNNKIGSAKLYSHRKIIGMGGINCPCCVPRGTSTKEVKKITHRIERRKMNEILKDFLKVS